jgi:1,4-alpha-glucan branching enzyme
MIPLLFMGDEIAAPEPFLFFTDHTANWPTPCAKADAMSLPTSARFSDSPSAAFDRWPTPTR